MARPLGARLSEEDPMTAITTTSAHHDQHENPMQAGADAVARYDAAIDALLRYHPSVVKHAMTLAEQHPDVAMANALVAYLHLMSTERGDIDVATAAWQGMSATEMGAREQAHRAAIGEWVHGRWAGAADALDELLVRWPGDLLALQIGHQLDFFLGDAANLRDRPGRSLASLDPDHPHTGFVLGMRSFGLEESGHYEAAEEAGQAAVAANPDDVWAIHAVTHAHEMRGRVEEGKAFLEQRVGDWGSGNLFTVHNWWHLGLFHLEQGEIAEVLDIYDREVHHAGSDGAALELLDASAMLWRLHLDGHATGTRFAALADAWAAADAAPWYAFNDLHAVMAYVGADRRGDAARVVDRMAAYVEEGGTGSNVAMTAEIGLPTSQAIVAFGEGRWERVIELLAPIRRRFQVFGGSHAQRDVLQRTLLEAAIRGGRTDLARALVSERLAVRPSSAYARVQQARLS
jgi:tetratricopeptide (TPR) repeat protein